ncbi:MAG: hypothetical protein KatS3mg113_1058 [Planctomycetaceae bacterium]|nr:MAG: hypothetical protein KatS3mg113_1058 [Planctomycetaceae bacterium]
MLLATQLWTDEAGFIVSAELILVATVAVLAMVVGLAEIALNVNNELEDVASAFGALNQSYSFRGVHSHIGNSTVGSRFFDQEDYCDNPCNVVPGEIVGER